ncbi:endonuclease/exonuclease/phosphatase family protein [Neisseriaceae bacterium B1]
MFDLPTGDWFLLALLLLPVAATLLSLSKNSHWTLRIFDFPRLQIAAVSLLCMLLNALFEQGNSFLFTLMEFINFACAAWQMWQISAYTRLKKPQVQLYEGEDNQRTVSILTSNVLTPNRGADKLLSLIQQYQPDLVLTVETDKWWETQLTSLEQSHPFCVKIPLDNLYGMHLYSRLPLQNAQVRYLVRDDIPSIHAQVQLPSSEWFEIYCLHPMPPSPTEAAEATERDGELLIVGKEIAGKDKTCMVFGDLNDVAWSDTSRLFQRISGLLDPRVGRGLFNTFNANHWWLRWPLDHIFISSDFLVTELQRLPHIGSDHFPVYGKFQFTPRAKYKHDAPQPEHGDKREAADKIDAAEPIYVQERTKYERGSVSG